MMKAGYGDCFLIKLKTNQRKPFNILVDSGTARSYSIYNEKIINNFIKDNTLDLIIITHSDDDHIKGFTRLFQKLLNDINSREKVKRVIYNSPYATAKYFNYSYDKLKKNVLNAEMANTSARSADSIQQKLYDLNLLEEKIIINDGNSDISYDGIKITFLSPCSNELIKCYEKYLAEKNKKKEKGANTKGSNSNNDYDDLLYNLKSNILIEKLNEYNCASIAFLIEENLTGNAILMMGDSNYEVVRKKLIKCKFSKDKKLILDYVKLSHHGSICDLNKDFLDIIDCNQYLISTDGSNYSHPDKKTLARIWKYNKDALFYFNYQNRINAIFKNEPDSEYKTKCIEKRSFNGTGY